MIYGHSRVISATFEQNQSCVTTRDRMVWTRTPTGNDSDVIFPTIAHFSGDFSNVQWTVTSHSKAFGLVPGVCGRFTDIRKSFRPLLSKIRHA